MSRRAWWWWRGIAVLVVAILLLVAALLLDLDPHPGRLALVTLLVGAGVALVLDTVVEPPPRWHTDRHAERRGGRARHDWRGYDDRTGFYVRLLEGHLAAREPDPAVRLRLVELTEQTLLARHGVPPDAAEAPALLGPDLVALLRAPAAWTTRDDIDRWIERIEAL